MPSVEVPRRDTVPPALETPQSALPPLVNSALPLAAPGTVTIGSTAASAARPAPTAFACLQCQLIGKRRLTCSRADGCAELPHSFMIGPLLLGGWLFTVIAFVLATR